MASNKIIAAVGAGRMGRGIAITFLLAGQDVLLIDAKQRTAEEFSLLKKAALDEIRTTLLMLADFELLDHDAIDALIERLTVLDLESCQTKLGEADIVFEGVPETLVAKQEAFGLISKCVGGEAIVASTTSTMLSDTLQSFVSQPQRFLNAHWLNPAFIVPLVELSPGKQTDPEITKQLKTYLESIGKVPVVCAASPGYIVPRIQALAMNEAARMVEEGVASVEDIDKATKYGFGFRFAVLGLLEFIDWGGGDILYHASRYMVDATGDERHASPQIIGSNMAEGRLGLKTQQGFMDYTNLDVASYQRGRMAAFVEMLRHFDLAEGIPNNKPTD